MKKSLLFLSMFFASGVVMANDNVAKSSFFVGVDVNDVMVKSDSISVLYNEYGKNATFTPSVDDSDVNFSLSFGYKYYIPETNLFVMPRLTYDLGKIKVDGDKGIEEHTASGTDIIEKDWESHVNFDSKPTYGMDVAFGYKFDNHNEIYLGVGLKNVDYVVNSYNTYKEEKENHLTDIDTIVNYDVFDNKQLVDDSKIVYPFSIGYVYNWRNMAFDIGYSYATFDINDVNVDLSTLKLGAKYMF